MLKLSCKGGKLSLEARAALAPDVFQALERECGLLLEGKEYIPERPVTATYERVTLEEAIEAIIRLADLPNTMLAMVSSGALKLAVLATGGKAPTKAVTRWRRRAPKVYESEALKKARRRFFLALPEQNRQRLLDQIKKFVPEEKAAELVQSLVE